MDLVLLVLGLVLIGFLTWVITEKTPMPPSYKEVIRWAVLIILVLFVVVRVFGKYIPNVL